MGRNRPGADEKAVERQDAALSVLARGVGHPLRIQILRELRETGTCLCGELVDVLPRAQSTVSQHLKILKQSGLVRGEVDGPRVCYCIDEEALGQLKQLIVAL